MKYVKCEDLIPDTLLIKNDTNTVTGRNLRKISDEANNYKILESDINQLKKDLHFEKVTDENIWKIAMIKELVQVKQNEMTIQFFDEKMPREQIDNMIDILSTM